VATSIDAFAVGLSFAALKIPILYPSVIVGIVAFLMTLLGTRIGPVIGRIAGKRAELLGGLILIIIGVRILIQHI
jgi:putative Mn2+ efflux pump MntP